MKKRFNKCQHVQHTTCAWTFGASPLGPCGGVIPPKKRESMKKILFLFVLATLLLMQGCSISNIAKDYSFDSNSPKGLLVGSITYEGYYAEYSIYVKNIDTEETHKISAGGSMTPFHLFNPKGSLDHLGVKGDLFAVELKPGSYEVYNWSVAPGNGTYLSARKPFSIKLKINNGKALYFGSVNFKQTETFGVTISGADAFYLTQYERDLKEFRGNYQNVNLPEIHSALKKGESLALGGDLKPDSSILFDAISLGLSMPTP